MTSDLNFSSVVHLFRSALMAVSLSTVFFGSAGAETVAGVVKTQQGSVTIERGGVSMPAVVGTKLMAGDVIKTSADTTVGLMMKDETRVSLGSNSQAALDKFAFNENTHSGNMLVSVVKGTLSMISGLLVKANPGQVLVRTPTSTAGIRGTEFIVDVPDRSASR